MNIDDTCIRLNTSEILKHME